MKWFFFCNKVFPSLGKWSYYLKAGSEFAQVQDGSGWFYLAGRACFAINDLCGLGHLSPLGTSVSSSGSNNRSRIISVCVSVCVCVYKTKRHKASKCLWEACT